MKENLIQARSCDGKAFCSDVDSDDDCTGCDLLIVCVTAVLFLPDFFASYARISTIACLHFCRLGLTINSSSKQILIESESCEEQTGREILDSRHKLLVVEFAFAA
jgi:hypothetical protein